MSVHLDCKTVRIFAYSSTHEQSNKRCGTRLKTESESGESPHRPYGRVRLARFMHARLLRHALHDKKQSKPLKLYIGNTV